MRIIVIGFKFGINKIDVITFTHCIHVEVYIVLCVSKYNVHMCMYCMCRCKCVHAVHMGMHTQSDYHLFPNHVLF